MIRFHLLFSQVEAIDEDAGQNGEVTYSLIEGGEGKFRISRKSGQVVLKKQLSREDQNKEFVLLIQAQDAGLSRTQFSVHSE